MRPVHVYILRLLSIRFLFLQLKFLRHRRFHFPHFSLFVGELQRCELHADVQRFQFKSLDAVEPLHLHLYIRSPRHA